MTINLLPGNTLDRIGEIPNERVELIITSPPYGSIVDYNNSDQIGFSQTVDQYYRDLDFVWNNCIRILNQGCRLVVNIGDEFMKGGEKPYHIIPHRSFITQSILSDPRMIYTGTIIWKKVNGSASGKNGKILGSVNKPRNGHFFVNREYLLTFKKLGKSPKVSKEQKLTSTFSTEERRIWFRDTWKIAPESQNIHPAMFPLEIPYRLIRMYSFVNETVFDPFCGSGTTLFAAELNQRNSIGMELGWTEDWIEIIREKASSLNIDTSNLLIDR